MQFYKGSSSTSSFEVEADKSRLSKQVKYLSVTHSEQGLGCEGRQTRRKKEVTVEQNLWCNASHDQSSGQKEYMLFCLFVFCFPDNLSWPQTHHAPEDGLQFLTFSPLQPEGRDCWHVPPGLAKSRCFYEKEMHDNKIR